MKKKPLSLLLVLVLCLGLVPQAYADNSPFADVAPAFWAYDAIVEAYNDGVMTGTATQTFSPDGKLDMAQFTTILARAFYKDELGTAGPGDNWWDPAYKIAYHDNHNLFGEVHNIAGNTATTREVMAEMMYRVMVDKGATLPSETDIQATMSKIPDISSVNSEFRTGVAVCYYLELLAGVDAQGTFSPKSILNRAETAVIYTRLKKAINEQGAGTSTPGTTNPGTANPGTASNPSMTQTPSSATLTNGMPVTEENVLALIEEYRNGKEPGQKAKDAGFTSYVNGSYYDAYNPKYLITLPSGPINGIECGKFAFAFFDDIFGSDAPIREVTKPTDLRTGDLIWYGGHWSILTAPIIYEELHGKEIYRMLEVGGGSTGCIGWSDGNTFGYIEELNGMEGFAKAIYTRYPE